MNFITRKRHWELSEESRLASQDATTLRDAMLGAMALVILAVLFAIWVTP